MPTKSKYTMSAEQLAILCSQCSMILRSGILFYDGIDILASSYRQSEYGALLETINTYIKQGKAMYEAFKETNAFPAYFLQMIKIAELTGNLESVLHLLSEYYKKEARLKETLRSALTYPLILLFMMAIVIGVMVIQVIPVFIRVYENLGISQEETPILNIGIGIGYAILVLTALIGIAAILLYILYKRHQGKEILLKAARFIPPLHHIFEAQAAQRFSQVVSMALRSGYSLEETIELLPRFMPTASSQKQAKTCYETFLKTNDFDQAIEASHLFAPLQEKMIEVGNETGQVDQVFMELSDLYEKRVDQGIEHIVSIVEPTIVALLTLIVGGILLSTMLPLISLMLSMG